MSLRHMGIYAIRNCANGKRYIGSSVNIHCRIVSHMKALNSNAHANHYLQNAWNMYGAKMFRFEVVEIITAKDVLVRREQYWMDHYRNKRGLYNIAPIAGSSLGRKVSEETRRKISKAHKGRVVSESTKITIAILRTGYKFSEDVKARMSASAKRRGPHPQESITKAAMSNTGKIRTQEMRERISASRRGKPLSEAHKAALQEAWIRRRVSTSPEVFSESIRKGWETRRTNVKEKR